MRHFYAPCFHPDLPYDFEYLDGADKDALLCAWVEEHFRHEPARVVAYCSLRENATVPKNDLVNKQYKLSDGRLVRVCPVSPEHKGDRATIFVIAEILSKALCDIASLTTG